MIAPDIVVGLFAMTLVYAFALDTIKVLVFQWLRIA
jgi:hypothetical protein